MWNEPDRDSIYREGILVDAGFLISAPGSKPASHLPYAFFYMSHVEITQSLPFGCAQHGTIWAGGAGRDETKKKQNLD